MEIKYKYYLDGSEVFPILKQSMSKVIAKESGERYFRESPSNGTVLFCDPDYSYILSKPIGWVYIFDIKKYNGSTYEQYMSCRFTKVDCMFDADDKTVQAKLQTNDAYYNVLKRIDTEYDFSKLSLEKQEVQIVKRPALQLYVLGEQYVQNVISGISWEQNCTEITSGPDLVGTYKFGLLHILQKINVYGPGLPEALKGDYIASGSSVTTWQGPNGDYRIEHDEHLVWNPGTSSFDNMHYYEIIRNSDDVVVFTSDDYLIEPGEGDTIDFTIPSAGSSGSLKGYISTTGIYGRWLLDVLQYDGNATYDRPLADITDENSDYSKVYPYTSDVITANNDYSSSPTEYGLMSEDRYFLSPGTDYWPVLKSIWGQTSLWIQFDTAFRLDEFGSFKVYTIKDVSSIGAVIRGLLAFIDPTISHDDDVAHSEFLYSASNPITSQEMRLFITLKTNITRGEYEQAATVGKITLRYVLDALKALQCYWFIDSSNRLRIEHIKWFKNGGSYTVSPSVGLDLTTLRDSRTKLPLSTSRNKFEYLKDELPQEYTFSFMDKSTLSFDGYPIIVGSAAILDGKKEEIQMPNFSTNIDYMLMNPSAFSEDGFALLGCFVNDSNLHSVAASGNSIGFRVDSTNGNLVANASYNATRFIPIFEGEFYTMSNLLEIAWYDNTQTYISGVDVGDDNNLTQQAPANACYLRCTVATFEWATFKVVQGSSIDGTYRPVATSPILLGQLVYLQNGYLSWLYMAPNFWQYDMPATDVEVNNGETMTVLGLKRQKMQSVAFCYDSDIDVSKLMKTGLGNGEIDEITINLFSRLMQIKLVYDTE